MRSDSLGPLTRPHSSALYPSVNWWPWGWQSFNKVENQSVSTIPLPISVPIVWVESKNPPYRMQCRCIITYGDKSICNWTCSHPLVHRRFMVRQAMGSKPFPDYHWKLYIVGGFFSQALRSTPSRFGNIGWSVNPSLGKWLHWTISIGIWIYISLYHWRRHWVFGACPHRDSDYRIGSNFWKVYLIRPGFTLREPVSLVKVFRLFRLERIVLVFRVWTQ